MIRYVKGDATAAWGPERKIIAHLCNDRGGWGKGFVLAISKRWSEPEQYYRRWFHSKEGFGLGAIQLVQVLPDTWVCNMVAQHGYKSDRSGPPIRYDALRKCLEQLAVEAEGLQATIHMPKIGTGLAGGSWELIEPVILETLSSRLVFIYTLE